MRAVRATFTALHAEAREIRVVASGRVEEMDDEPAVQIDARTRRQAPAYRAIKVMLRAATP
jgi:hypothetical protein